MAKQIFFEERPEPGQILEMSIVSLGTLLDQAEWNGLGDIVVVEIVDSVVTERNVVTHETARRHAPKVVFRHNEKEYTRDAYWPGSDEWMS